MLDTHLLMEVGQVLLQESIAGLVVLYWILILIMLTNLLMVNVQTMLDTLRHKALDVPVELNHLCVFCCSSVGGEMLWVPREVTTVPVRERARADVCFNFMNKAMLLRGG